MSSLISFSPSSLFCTHYHLCSCHPPPPNYMLIFIFFSCHLAPLPPPSQCRSPTFVFIILLSFLSYSCGENNRSFFPVSLDVLIRIIKLKCCSTPLHSLLNPNSTKSQLNKTISSSFRQFILFSFSCDI